MKAVRVRPAEADAFINETTLQGKLGPHRGRGGQRGRTKRGLGSYHKVPEDLPVSRGFM